MKKIGSLVLALLLFVGCSQNNNSESDYEKLYAPILKEIEEIILSKEDDEYLTYEGINGKHTAIVDLVNSSYDMNLGGLVGYSISKLNDDDIPELIIGLIDSDYSETDEPEYGGMYLFEIYSVVNGKVKQVTAINYLDDFHLLADGTLFKIALADEDVRILHYEIKDGDLAPIDIFVSRYDSEAQTMRYYIDKDKNIETEDFEDMQMTENEFGDFMTKYWENMVSVDLVPIVEFDYTRDLIYDRNGSYPAHHYFDVFELEKPSDYPDIKEYVISDSQYSVKAVVEVLENMEDVEIIKVSAFESPELGIDYDFEGVLYKVGNLEPGDRLLLQLEIPELVSDTAISFFDYYGERKYYVIYTSGKDGSLGTEEIYPGVG